MLTGFLVLFFSGVCSGVRILLRPSVCPFLLPMSTSERRTTIVSPAFQGEVEPCINEAGTRVSEIRQKTNKDENKVPKGQSKLTETGKFGQAGPFRGDLNLKWVAGAGDAGGIPDSSLNPESVIS